MRSRDYELIPRENLMSILVAGATGFVGGAIVQRLRQKGLPVAALVRGGEAHPAAEKIRGVGAEIVEGDLTDAGACVRACQGRDVVISTATSMPTGASDGLRRVDHEGSLALIDAAVRNGVKRFVYLSFSGNIRQASPLETAKRASENQLLASEMTAVILRPSYFMEVWLSPALGFDPPGGSVRIYGSGEGRVSYVSGNDVADFAAAAAVRNYTEKNTILEIGGPEPLSQLAAVRVFEEALGKALVLQHVPTSAIEAQRQSADPLQKTFGALISAYASGDVITGAMELAQEYGISLQSVSTYAAQVRERGTVPGH
jgi:uncharacterized protein YbjT (DUF2867 family)